MIVGTIFKKLSLGITIGSSLGLVLGIIVAYNKNKFYKWLGNRSFNYRHTIYIVCIIRQELEIENNIGNNSFILLLT